MSKYRVFFNLSEGGRQQGEHVHKLTQIGPETEIFLSPVLSSYKSTKL